MVAADAEMPARVELDATQTSGTLMGKRYANGELGLELLCTRPGEGSLLCNGEALHPEVAKSLPSSD